MPIKKTTTKKSSPSKAVRSEMDKWGIENAMSTIQRAVEIQKNPKLMQQVKKMAADKVRDLDGIAKGKTKV